MHIWQERWNFTTAKKNNTNTVFLGCRFGGTLFRLLKRDSICYPVFVFLFFFFEELANGFAYFFKECASLGEYNLPSALLANDAVHN